MEKLTQNEFTFLMYHIAVSYLDTSLEDDNRVPPIVFTAHRVARSFTLTRSVDKVLLGKIKRLETDEIREVLNENISFLIFSMELIRLMKPTGQIKQQKLDRFIANYTISMLELKKRDIKAYQEKKELITKSQEVAQKLFEFWKENTEK